MGRGAIIGWVDNVIINANNQPTGLISPLLHYRKSGDVENAKIPMDLLPDTYYYGLCMHRECRERFPRHRGLAIPTCITARASRTFRDAWRDRYLAISFEVGGGENVPGIPGACATRSFTHLIKGPLRVLSEMHKLHCSINNGSQFNRFVIWNQRWKLQDILLKSVWELEYPKHILSMVQTSLSIDYILRYSNEFL